jgi:hypothetical protein
MNSEFAFLKFVFRLSPLILFVASSCSILEAETVNLQDGSSFEYEAVVSESPEAVIFARKDGVLIRMDRKKLKSDFPSKLSKNITPASESAIPSVPAVENQAKNEEKPQFQVTQQMGNDLVVLGSSVFGERLARRNAESYKQFNEAWNLATNVVFLTPIPQFRTNIIVVNPLVGRNNRDVDGFFQSSPGGADQTNQVAQTLSTGVLLYDPNQVRQRVERNGLRDALIGQFAYEWNTKIGDIGTGVFFVNSQSGGVNSELGSYTLSWKPGFDITRFVNLQFNSFYRFTSDVGGIFQGNSQHRASISHEFFQGQFFRITPSVSTGYQYFNNNTDRRSGFADISSRLQFNFGPLFLALNDVFRPTLSLFDNSTYYPTIGRYKDTNGNDGNTVDPSRAYGNTNKLVTDQIANSGYPDIVRESLTNSYQQQKIHRHQFIINIGYSVRF